MNTTSKVTQLVSIGDIIVTNNPQTTLLVHGVGSSVGVVLYDPQSNTTGIIHLMLPDSQLSPNRIESKPGMFADTGMSTLFSKFSPEQKDRLKVFITGGANAITTHTALKIGEKNIERVKSFLEKEDISIAAEELGGQNNRSLSFSAEAALVKLKENLQKKEIQL